MVKDKMEPVMWAEMSPDVYAGKSGDKHEPRWATRSEGQRDGDDYERSLRLDARLFPPGTKIVISEPRCPSCDETREPIYPTPTRGPAYGDKCRCGFDWKAWVEDRYS